MKRPYVICHILSSLDGKINGPFMSTHSAGSLAQEYGRLRAEMDADAWMYGTSTTKEFTAHKKPVLKDSNPAAVKGDFVADDHAELYYVSIDTAGEIGWESGTFNIRGRDSHVIELLTEATPDAYKAYHIKKLLLCGGIADWSFLKAGMVDELSLLLAPVTDGSRGTASLFEQLSPFSEESLVEFTLKSVSRISENGLYLKYRGY